MASDALVRNDASFRLGCDPAEITIERFVQSFPSTRCGFPGVGGAAITDAEVTVACSPEGGAAVYVLNRLCYVIAETNELFQEALERKQLAMASRYAGEYDDQPLPAEELFTLKDVSSDSFPFSKVLKLAYEEASGSYGRVAGKTATIIRVSDGAIIGTVIPAADGGFPERSFTAEAAPYLFDGRFPPLGAMPDPAEPSSELEL